MKKISIVGIGMGPSTLTAEGREIIGKAEVLMGAPRMLAYFEEEPKVKIPEYLSGPVAEALAKSTASNFAILVSGDTGFFSAAGSLSDMLTRQGYDVEFCPGISSVSAFFAKLKKPWQDVHIVSCHGRSVNLEDVIRRNKASFILTGDNVLSLAEELNLSGFGDLTVYAGENLGSDQEKIEVLKVKDLSLTHFGSLLVLLIENPEADSSVRIGIPDEEFIRGEVPMTKSEVRAVTLSKLHLFPDSVCADIGAGTGSVTVEMALSAYEGTVYAIEKKAEAVFLIRENCRKFQVGNVRILEGEAPEALKDLPPLDAAFIGGSSGKMEEIFRSLLEKNPHVRIVVNVIAIESIAAALNAYKTCGIEPEVVQLQTARAKSLGGWHLMTGLNPVTILAGGGLESGSRHQSGGRHE